MVDRISFEGDYGLAEAGLPYARACANVVTSIKKTLGISRMNRSFESEDGTQVYVVDQEFQRVIHIVPPIESDDFESDTPEWFEHWSATAGIPDYVSGAVIDSVIEQEKVRLPGDAPDGEPPTYPMVREFRSTTKTADRVPMNMARHKLAVESNAAFTWGSALRSQHHDIKAGLYTGAMRPLVQVLLGVGHVRPETYEQRWMAENPLARPPIAFDVDEDGNLADGTERPESAFGLGGTDSPQQYNPQITLDYRFNRTHGISWGQDGRAYIVEIGRRGVHVMPLQVDPISRTDAGRNRYRHLFPELFDSGWSQEYPGETFFDAFGGFPIGTPPPMGAAALDRLVRAGEVVEALSREDMEPFYDNQQYSSVTGWAFHPNGSIAHNTCHGVSDTGDRIGYHFAVPIHISAETATDPSEHAMALIARFELTGVDRRKALRMTQEQAQNVMDVENNEAARELFDSESVAAQFQVQASLREMRRGGIYHPAHFFYQPQIKFPEPLVGGVLSFDFTSNVSLAMCDTPLYVFFRGSVLTVINYSLPMPHGGEGFSENTREPCQFIGSWENIQFHSRPTVLGNFYTTDADFRELVGQEGGLWERTTGNFVAKIAELSFCAFLAKHSDSAWRYYHDYEYEGWSYGARSVGTSIAIPLGDRSFYMAARSDMATDVRRWTGYTAPSFSGIGSGRARGVIRHSPFHWTYVCEGPPPSGADPGPENCTLREYGSPYQVPSCFHDEITVQDTFYEPCPDGPFTYQKLFAPEPQGQNHRHETGPNLEYEIEIKLYGDTHAYGRTTSKGEFVFDRDQSGGAEAVIGANFSSWWGKSSPDAFGNIASIAVNINRFGSALIGFQPDFERDAEHLGGPAEMHVSLSACYVGWVS